MAKVPNYGGPQVTPSILGYRPMSDYVPSVPRAEIDVTKPAARLDKIYTKFLEEQDEARVTAALTELRRKAVDMETAEGGWAQQLGSNALEPDEQGRGLIERTDTGLHEFGTEIASKLTARQQKLFNEKAEGIYQSTYAGVSQHVFQQGVKVKIAAQADVVDQAVELGATYVNKPDLLKQNAKDLAEAAHRLAEFQGWTPEATDLYIKKNKSSMYMNGIATILAGTDKNPAMAYQALGVLKAHSKEMLASDVARARQQINPIIQAYEDRMKVERFMAGMGTNGEALSGGLARAVRDGVVSQDVGKTARGFEAILSVVSQGGHQSVMSKEGDIADWKHGASQLTIAQAEEAAKASGQVWDPKAFKTDRDYNQAVGLGRYGGMLTEFAGDEAKAMAGYLSSAETVRKAEKEAEKKGGAWNDYLPKKTQETLSQATRNMRSTQSLVDVATGESISGFDPRYARSAKTWMTVDQIRDYFKKTDKRAAVDPLYCDDLVNKAYSLLQQKKSSYVQQQNNVKAQISDVLFKTKGDTGAIPQSLLQQLDTTELSDVQKLAKHYASESFASDPMILGKLDDDRFLMSLSEDDLKLYLNHLNLSDRGKTLRRWSKLKQGAVGVNDSAAQLQRMAKMGMVTKDYEVSDDAIRSVLAEDPEYLKMKKDDPAAAAIYLNILQEKIGVAGQERLRKYSNSEVKAEVRRIRSDMTPVKSLFGASDTPIFKLDVEDLPNEGLSDAYQLVKSTTKARLQAIGQDREPTKEELQETMYRILLGDDRLPFVVPSDVSFDEPLMKEIKETWAKKYPGRTLTQAMQQQLYIRARYAGQKGKPTETTSWRDNAYIDMYGVDDLNYWGGD